MTPDKDQAIKALVGSTVEIHPDGGDGTEYDHGHIVDVVRIDDRWHFVVVADA